MRLHSNLIGNSDRVFWSKESSPTCRVHFNDIIDFRDHLKSDTWELDRSSSNAQERGWNLVAQWSWLSHIELRLPRAKKMEGKVAKAEWKPMVTNRSMHRGKKWDCVKIHCLKVRYFWYVDHNSALKFDSLKINMLLSHTFGPALHSSIFLSAIPMFSGSTSTKFLQEISGSVSGNSLCDQFT